MPMYRHEITKDTYEVRTCHRENKKDIESWAGVKRAKIGEAYQKYGHVDKYWLERNFEELEPCV